MFVRLRKNSGTLRKSIVICHSVRLKSNIKQVTVKTIGHSADPEEQAIFLENARAWIIENKAKWMEKYLPSKQQLTMKHKLSILNLREQKRLNVGIPDIFGVLYKNLGFTELLSGKHAETLRRVIFSRLLEPGSKRRLSSLYNDKFGEELPLDRIYRMMDALSKQEDFMQQQVFAATKKACNNKVKLVLFDVTTLSFETIAEDDIRTFGFSKDHKFNTVQVVLGLATTPEGLPIGYKLFPGNTAECKTLIECINKWKQIIPIEKVTIVGDRAMMSQANIKLLENLGFEYIVAAPLRKMSESIKAEILDFNSYNNTEDDPEVNKFKIIELSAKQRLVVSYSAKRAAKDKKDRERLISRLEKKLSNSKNPKKLINNQGYLKFTDISKNAVAIINQEKAAEDARWDGIHGIITNSNYPANIIYTKYRHLWVIEESFRINKHTLKMRPIYHFATERIKTHIAICYMVFALIRHAQFHLLQQGHNFSAQRIIDSLKDVQASIYQDITTDIQYKVMSKLTEDATHIYDAFKIKKNTQVVQLDKQFCSAYA